MTAAERASASNTIWLCQSCAKLVDNDPLRYPVAILRDWRLRAESAPAAHAARNADELGATGGNITGLSDFDADVVAKRLELLKEAVPTASRIGVLLYPEKRPIQGRTAVSSCRKRPICDGSGPAYNRVWSSARIIAHLQWVCEGGRQREWLGWENALRELRPSQYPGIDGLFAEQGNE
jgi:hypothetical protein